MAAPRTQGPAYENLQRRKPRWGTSTVRLALRGKKRGSRFRREAIFDHRQPRNPCTTWAVGTSIANGDLTFLTLCNFKELDVAKTAQSATSALSASRRSLSHIEPT